MTNNIDLKDSGINLGIIGTNFISDTLVQAAKMTGLCVSAVFSRRFDTGEAFAKKHASHDCVRCLYLRILHLFIFTGSLCFQYLDFPQCFQTIGKYLCRCKPADRFAFSTSNCHRSKSNGIRPVNMGISTKPMSSHLAPDRLPISQ